MISLEDVRDAPVSKGHIAMWSFLGAFLWVPTAVNAFIGMEIIQLAIEHSHGHFDGFDGFDIAMHIIAASLPIAVTLAIGWIILSILRLKVPRSPEAKRDIGCLALTGANVVAPGVLFLGLRWVL
jgi:hypothetical protein